jgi:eukaryotic-like serine/threonine-protein kinase
VHDDEKNLEEIFHRLIDLPPGDREQAALSLANLDTAVAHRALELVEAHEKALAANRQMMSASFAAAPPKEFGPYRTVRLLGAGGMGAVYLCERSDGEYRGQVAVKVIGQHLAGPGFEERFRAERQILAGLNHPNIARFLDGNVTENGEPYLVLEYVEGEQLDVYCENRSLDTAQRLALFLKVCGAVDFAHRSLVVHRDLKPANILVTAAGEPKLLDFGAARLLSAEAARTTIPLLTLRYASPEQLRAQAVTTAADVYSLGVVLYELIAGESPFGNADSWELALNRASHDVPLAPNPKLTGDLWTVIRKALAREAERRYPTVRELAEDIERFLAGRPILARPSTFGYRAAKFVERNRLASGVAALLLLAVTAGTATTLWQARNAQRRFDQLRQLASYMVGDMSAGLLQLPGSTPLLKANVERSLVYLDGLAADSQGDAKLRLEAAEGYLRLGDVLGNPYRANLSERARAREAYQRGLAILAAMPATFETRRLAAELHLQIGGVRSFGGERNAGLDELRTAVGELRLLAAERPGDAGTRLAAARGIDFLGRQRTAGGGNVETAEQAEPLALFAEALQQNEAVLTGDSRNFQALRQAAMSEINIALLFGSGAPERALDHYRSALAYLGRVRREDAESLELRRMRGNLLSNQGWALGQSRQYPEAIAALNEAEKIYGAISTVDPGNTQAMYQLTSVYRARGIVEEYRSRYDRSAEEFLRAAELHRQLSEKDPANKVYRYLRGELLVRAANGFVRLKRVAAARLHAAEGLAIIEGLAAAPNAGVSHVFGACRFLAETEVVELRQLGKAEKYCRLAMELTKSADPDAFAGLAVVLELRGDKSGALAMVEKALALIPPAAPGKPVSKQRTDFEDTIRRLRGPASR